MRGLEPKAPRAPPRRRRRLPPERLLPELLAVSGAPGGLPGLLVWRCLAANLVASGELLGLPAAAELLAEGVLGLHAGAGAA